ncbi:MAG: electron transfer flavoprotein subunit alpha/FixB family protein [Dehalococcoidia bacterium]|nr:electron transfer flavoprotein subunit alpha/FixB family protein [Dehalococcoidia bacterium]
MKEYSGVLVYGEVVNGKLSGTTCELLGCGRQLADTMAQTLSCVLTGQDDIETCVAEAGSRGADTVFTAKLPAEDSTSPSAHIAVAAEAVAQASPALILIGHTSIGRELGPRLGFRLGSAVATDCINIRIDEQTKEILVTKPVYGGNALADFAAAPPQVVTVRPKAMSAGDPDLTRKATSVVDLQTDAVSSGIQILERIQEEVVGVKLEDAVVVVSGGRGTAGPEPFNTILKDLADALHGAVGASRPPCDNGWAPETMHIGLTGKIVAPQLYVAVAISGASQHMAGCSGSKTIVAVNKDAEANIFLEADYGVVGRFEDVVPAFTAKVKELLAE